MRSSARLQSASGVDEPASDALISDADNTSDRDAKAQLSRVILNREPLYSEVAKHIMEAKHTQSARAMQPDEAQTSIGASFSRDAEAAFESVFGGATGGSSLTLAEMPNSSDNEEKKQMFGGGIGGGTVFSRDSSSSNTTKAKAGGTGAQTQNFQGLGHHHATSVMSLQEQL